MKRLNKWSYILLTLVITWILQFMPILLLPWEKIGKGVVEEEVGNGRGMML